MKVQNLGIIITKEDTKQFREQHSEVNRWIRKIESDTSRKHYLRRLTRYCRITEKTPKELIALKKNSVDHEAEDLLDEFVDSCNENNIPCNVTWNIVVAVKSFYKWNYLDLSKAAGKGITRIKIKAYHTPDKESLIKFLQGAHIRDEALISFMACTSIAEGSIPHLNWSHVSEDNEIPHIALASTEIKGQGKGAYANVEQHTFLTPYAKTVLTTYKEWRQRKENRKLSLDDPLFATLDKPYKALSTVEVRKIFERRSQNTGIQFSPHDMRRFVQTALETARTQPNWIKKILRHKVKGEENPYSQPKIEALREAFKTALPYLDLSIIPMKADVEQQAQQVQELRKELAETKLAVNIIKTFLTGEQLQKLQLEQARKEFYEKPKETTEKKTE